MKNIFFFFALFITFSSIAQNSNQVEFEKQKLKQALIYGDQSTATNMMYNIIALEGEKSVYKDSLAYLYFNRRSYLSCFLATEDALKNNPNNVELLEMSAFSIESLGAYEKAITSFEKLLSVTNNNFHAYKVATLYFQVNKFDEAYAAVKKADALPDSGKENISFPINKNYNQPVPLKAAIVYLKGLAEQNLNDKTAAKASFKKAMQVFPEFILAKDALSNLEVKPKE
ncbi:MAG: hypothetical protein QM478_07670 [Flavobacteriaceae bacterium]